MKRTSLKLSNEAVFRLAVQSALFAGLSAAAGTAFAQAPATPSPATTPSGDTTELETIEVTGTRIVAPGIVSASPIYSVESEEITLQQQPELERVFRLLPITAPDDGQNVNNGTAGVGTINLRGLGAQRNLILVNGKRLTPYNFNGLVDASIIPVSIIERIDIITGGASAVYGSDAMSGAINIITKRDFQGMEVGFSNSFTGEKDGDTNNAFALLGGNFGDGRGNAIASLNWTDREGVQLGQRPLGRLGIETATGAGLSQFLAGQAPAVPADPLCQGPNAVAAGGSTTTIPTRVAIAGGPGLGQFRSNGTLGTNCSVFNFNPYNYYQTPAERFGGTFLGHFDVTRDIQAYSRLAYTETQVTQQVAPSGVFGTAFFTPLNNPLIGASARGSIITAANIGVAASTVCADGDLGGCDGDSDGATDFVNWVDTNSNNTVDTFDELLISYRRRTEELGPRSTSYDTANYQFLLGGRTDIFDTWNMDLSYQRGISERTNISAGYTNVANIEQQLNSIDGVTCAGTSDPACVPINLFGGFGTITPAAAAYASATALEKQTYTQHITSAVMSGTVPQLDLPFATRALGLSVGAEQRREKGEEVPDECLKLAPASCLGGAGGNTLPISGGFKVNEVFGEAIVPIVDNVAGANTLDLELGYRHSNYKPSGTNETWKYGVSWGPIEPVLFRIMQQRAARAPNVGELAAPQTASLQNATLDPCSIANAANLEAADPNDAALRATCISTGMTAAQVGTVEDIVSGQINTFSGTDLTDLPKPEEADTTTVGIVFTPKIGGFFRDVAVTLDYYKIDINDVIGTFAPQEILDACYTGGQTAECAKIRRIGGTLTLPGSGIETFTTNLKYLKAEGLELGAYVGFDIGALGGIKAQFNANKYLTQESQSSGLVPVLECLGFFGTSCGGPLPETRWIQRTTWDWNQLQLSYLWRHIGEVEREPVEVAQGATIEEFRRINPHDYLDLAAGYSVYGPVRLNVVINNVLDKDPPVVGNEAADTGSNSGNTFPSHYDTLGRVFILGFNANF
jgi:outer membrane receptor protein involved in Fe transport